MLRRRLTRVERRSRPRGSDPRLFRRGLPRDVDGRRKPVLETATALVAGRAGEDDLPFAANTVVSYLIDSVLDWLEFGDPKQDEMFVAATDAAMREALRMWKKLLARASPSRSATG